MSKFFAKYGQLYAAVLMIMLALTLPVVMASAETEHQTVFIRTDAGMQEKRARAQGVSLHFHEPFHRSTPEEICQQFRVKFGVLALSDEEILTVLQCSNDFDIPIEMGLAVMERESQFNRDIVGEDGHDFGYFQIRDSNHEWLRRETGADPMDPVGNIICGFWLLRYVMDMADNNPRIALTIYRWGHDNGDYAYANDVLSAMDKYVPAEDKYKPEQEGEIHMATICYKPKGSCPNCTHNRFDPEAGRNACFLQQDLTPEEYARYEFFGELRKHIAEREAVAQ